MIIIKFSRVLNGLAVKWQTIKFNTLEDALKVCENLRENGYAYKIENNTKVLN